MTPETIAELRDQIAGTIHRRICEHSREECIENLGWCERATDAAMPMISGALDAAAERDALAAKVARVRDWLDHRGVDASDRDGAYMDGYRAAQRHAVQDAAELRRALDGRADS